MNISQFFLTCASTLLVEYQEGHQAHDNNNPASQGLPLEDKTT